MCRHPIRDRSIYRGSEVVWRTPLKARTAGVAVVHQELSLVSELTVAENVFLRREPRSSLRLLSVPQMNKMTADLLEQLGIAGIRPHMVVRQLSPSQRQVVEIAKAVKDSPAVLILDEPTSTLGEQLVAWLFDQVGRWCGGSGDRLHLAPDGRDTKDRGFGHRTAQRAQGTGRGRSTRQRTTHRGDERPRARGGVPPVVPRRKRRKCCASRT